MPPVPEVLVSVSSWNKEHGGTNSQADDDNAVGSALADESTAAGDYAVGCAPEEEPTAAADCNEVTSAAGSYYLPEDSSNIIVKIVESAKAHLVPVKDQIWRRCNLVFNDRIVLHVKICFTSSRFGQLYQLGLLKEMLE